MGETAAALGVGPDFEFEGRRWKIAPRNLETEAEFELFVEGRALNSIRRMRGNPGDGKFQPEEYALQMEGWRHDVAAFAYSFDGPICWRALLSVPGAKHMAFLQLAYANEEMEPEVVDRIFADAEAWKRLMALLNQVNNPPNSPAPTGEVPPAKD